MKDNEVQFTVTGTISNEFAEHLKKIAEEHLKRPMPYVMTKEIKKFADKRLGIAAQAMVGMLSRGEKDYNHVASEAFRFADALLMESGRYAYVDVGDGCCVCGRVPD